MRQEFSLRFELASGAKFVTAHAYVRIRSVAPIFRSAADVGIVGVA